MSSISIITRSRRRKLRIKKYRAVGLGTSGYHQMLATHRILWESGQHLEHADETYEWIAYCAIQASMEIAGEKRRISRVRRQRMADGGVLRAQRLRQSRVAGAEGTGRKARRAQRWMFAIAPTASTSLIAGSTAGIDPIFNKFFVEEKKKCGHSADGAEFERRHHVVLQGGAPHRPAVEHPCAGKRQKHIDQSQSFNLYITPEITAKEFLELYMSAWENGLKTVYYCRNKSLEVEDASAARHSHTEGGPPALRSVAPATSRVKKITLS